MVFALQKNPNSVFPFGIVVQLRKKVLNFTSDDCSNHRNKDNFNAMILVTILQQEHTKKHNAITKTSVLYGSRML